jgi:hypothetical protein
MTSSSYDALGALGFGAIVWKELDVSGKELDRSFRIRETPYD